MRTTLDIDDGLLQAARERAARNGTTLTAVVEHALAAMLASKPNARKPFRLNLETERGRYIGRVDPANRDALYDVMEDRP
jgi:hypothetical protein